MRLGIDVTPIQGAHRLRGIGSVIIQAMNHIDPKNSKDIVFVIYQYPDYNDDEKVADILNLDPLRTEVRFVNKAPTRRGPKKVWKAIRLLQDFLFGDSRHYDTKDIDAFLQLDQSTSLPRTKVKKYLVAYDIIPFVLEHLYLRGYRTARNAGARRRRALKDQVRRWQYQYALRANCRRADVILPISEHTKKDFTRHLGVKESKMNVITLGSINPIETEGKVVVRPFKDTGWGPFRQKEMTLESRSYLMYVGGIDERRKLIDLVAAYNNLRARGEDIHLVLAGDILTTSHNIPNPDLFKYMEYDTYMDNVHYLGFVSEEDKSRLMSNAEAVVYPSLYEGFGLPVIEAMKHGAPIICYNNSSIAEVGGDAALYAENMNDITNYVLKLRTDDNYRQSVIEKGLKQGKKFDWDRTAQEILDAVRQD